MAWWEWRNVLVTWKHVTVSVSIQCPTCGNAAFSGGVNSVLLIIVVSLVNWYWCSMQHYNLIWSISFLIQHSVPMYLISSIIWKLLFLQNRSYSHTLPVLLTYVCYFASGVWSIAMSVSVCVSVHEYIFKKWHVLTSSNFQCLWPSQSFPGNAD